MGRRSADRGRPPRADWRPAGGTLRQEARGREYGQFHARFRALLQGKTSAAEYAAGCAGTTAAFKGISDRIRGLEARLRGAGEAGELAAAHVRAVQEAEREKLRMVSVLQVLKQAHHAERWSWQADPTGDGEEADPAPAGHGGGCGCGGERADPQAAPEPTQEEYSNAVQEATLVSETVLQARRDFRRALGC